MTKGGVVDTVKVLKLIEVDPDEIIKLGHKLKQAAMDCAFPGDSVLISLTDEISLVYRPEKEFLKPKQTFNP